MCLQNLRPSHLIRRSSHSFSDRDHPLERAIGIRYRGGMWGRLRRNRSRTSRRTSTALMLATLGLAVLVIAVAVQRGVPSVAPAKPAPTSVLPTILKPGVNWLSPSDITVLDGDTIRTGLRVIRLAGFDTPESGNRARCSREREMAERATAQLRNLIANSGLDMRLVPCACAPGTEGTSACNYGRACAYLRVHGKDVGAALISQGLAKPYLCGTHSCPPRQSWC